MLEISRYIHLNPVRANMVNSPQEYEWSSYNIYIGVKENEFISSNKIFFYLKKRQVELYRKFVERTASTNILTT